MEKSKPLAAKLDRVLCSCVTSTCKNPTAKMTAKGMPPFSCQIVYFQKLKNPTDKMTAKGIPPFSCQFLFPNCKNPTANMTAKRGLPL